MPAVASSPVAATSDMTVGLDALCLVGLAARNQVTTLAADLAKGAQVATVGSTGAFGNDARLVIDTGSAQETVVASSVTATSFSANFANSHAAGAPVVLERQVVGRIDHGGQASQISQDFGNPSGALVACSPVDANQLYCVTGNENLWHTTAGASAGSGTVWTAMPAGESVTGYDIASVAVDQAGTVFLLMLFPVTIGSGEASTTTPLFRVDAGGWTPIASSGLPSAGFLYGRLVADPRTAGTLHASYGASVFEIVVAGNAAAWTSASAGLPGGTISDMWATSISDVRGVSGPITLLRAAVPTRGVWELAQPDPSSAAPLLYVRDNVADLGWIDTAKDGGPDPYSAGGQIWHYQCPDIKVDAQQPGASGGPRGDDAGRDPAQIAGIASVVDRR